MKVQFCLLDADYVIENGKTIVRLFGKDSKGKTVVALDTTFSPYFYVLPKQGKENEVKKRIEKALEKEKEMKIKGIEVVERNLSGAKRKFLKVICDIPPNVPKIRDIVKEWEDGVVEEEYEYSISFYKRYMIDKSISGASWVEVGGEKTKRNYQADIIIDVKNIKLIDRDDIPNLKILGFDIENVEEQGKQKIIMLSLAGDNFKKVLTYQKDSYPKWVEVVKDEKELLERFVKLVNELDPDILIGFNSDSFDFQIIQQRADELKVNLALSRDGSHLKFARRARISSARFKGRVHIDLFDFIDNILSPQLQTEVITLDSVSAELLGDKKIEMQFEEILEAWRKKKDLTKLAEYCLKDSELAVRLSKLILPQIYELSRLTGQLPFDVSRMTYGQLVEWYLSKKAFEMKETIPNQPKWEDIQERRLRTYVGGFVKEPLPGIHENIAILDFKSLYPSIIATFNISPETFKCCKREEGLSVPETEYWFCKKHKGFVSLAIKNLIERRKEIKNKMKGLKKDSEEYKRLDNEQYATKITANATYGYFAFAGSKWYCKECAESSAAYGRFFIKKAISEAEKENFVVIYADTDSCFVKLEKGNLEKKIDEFLKNTNKKLPGILELDLQGYYKRGIFIPREIGGGTAKKKYALIDKKGTLLVRGLEKVRRDWSDIAKNTQEAVLKYVLEKKDVNGAVKYVQDVIKKIRAHKVTLRELIIYEQLTKPLAEYKAIGPHVSAARKIKERGRPIGAGMVIMFVITKGKGSISERAEPIEDVELKDIDEDYYITHQIIPPVLRVLSVLNVTEELLLGKSLKKFFKK